MKKLFPLFICAIFVFALSACGERQKAQELYDAIGSISFQNVICYKEFNGGTR